MNIAMYTGFTELVKDCGIREAAQYTASLGFSSVELLEFVGSPSFSPTFKTNTDAAEAAMILKDHGLSVACFSVAVDIVDIYVEKPAPSSSAIKHLKFCADIAAALGSPFLHHTLLHPLKLSQNAPSYDEVFPIVLEAAKEVADHCLPLGITCLYEPQGMYFNGEHGFGNFFRALKEKCKNVGVCGDIGNMLFVDESEWIVFAQHADDIKHVHIKDYYVKDKLSKGEVCKYPSRGGRYILRAPIGMGDLNIDACLKCLDSAGYCGVFSIEDSDMSSLSNTVKVVKDIISNYFD